MNNNVKSVKYEFGVKNYKVFDSAHWINISPITILTGPNSSGKSSLVKLIELIRDNFQEGVPFDLNFNEPITQILNFDSDSEELELTFKLFEFGEEKALLALTYELGQHEPNLEFRLSKVALSLNDRKVYSYFERNELLREVPGEGQIDSKEFFRLINLCLKREVTIAEGLSRVYRDQAEKFNSRGNLKDSIIQNIIRQSQEKSDFYNKKAQEYKKIANESSSLFSFEHEDSALQGVIDNSRQRLIDLEQQCIQDEFDGERVYEEGDNKAYLFTIIALEDTDFLKHEGKINVVNVYLKEQILKLKDDLSEKIKSELGNIKVNYSRYGRYVYDEFWNLLGRRLKGTLEDFQFMQRIESQKSQYDEIFNIREPKNLLANSIKNYYEYQNNPFARGDYFQEFKTKWLKKFEIGSDLEVDAWNDSYARLSVVGFDGRKIDVTKMGFGVGQVISLIMIPFNYLDDERKQYPDIEEMHDAYGRDRVRKLIALEEPEINLHPNWQSLVADLIVDIHNTFGITFIIETHSEYLIRKLQYLVANKEAKWEDCDILYFKSQKAYKEEDKKGKKVFYNIGLRPDGITEKDFGKGFFDESTRWTVNLMNLQNLN